MTSDREGGGGLAKFWLKEGRLREIGTEKGGGGQKSRKFSWRHLCTAPYFTVQIYIV